MSRSHRVVRLGYAGAGGLSPEGHQVRRCYSNGTHPCGASVVSSLAFRPLSDSVQRVSPMTSERRIWLPAGKPAVAGWVIVPTLVREWRPMRSTTASLAGHDGAGFSWTAVPDPGSGVIRDGRCTGMTSSLLACQ